MVGLEEDQVFNSLFNIQEAVLYIFQPIDKYVTSTEGNILIRELFIYQREGYA
jgi:hypothetical protein